MNSSAPTTAAWRQPPISAKAVGAKVSSRIPGCDLAWLVGFFFSFRNALVLLCVHVVGLEPQTGSALIVAASGMLLALATFHSFGKSSDTLVTLSRLGTSRWILLFLAFSFLSFIWSGSVSPSASFAYWGAMAADAATVALLLTNGAVAGPGEALMRGYIASSCCLALLAWLMPAQSDLRLGDPEYFNTNQIANLCAFAIFFAQFLARRKTGQWNIVTTLLSITLLRTLSKTTLAAFLISQACLLSQDRSISRKTKAWAASAAAVMILLFWGLFSSYYDIYTNAGNQAQTLTGRTAVWAFAAEHALEHPWIGNGFDSMWKVMPPFGPDQFEARHAENEILQQFYSYGIMGLTLLGGIYTSLYRQIRRVENSPVRILLSSLMLFIVIRGMAEAEPFDLLLPLWVILLVGTLVSPEMSPECNFSSRSSQKFAPKSRDAHTIEERLSEHGQRSRDGNGHTR